MAPGQDPLPDKPSAADAAKLAGLEADAEISGGASAGTEVAASVTAAAAPPSLDQVREYIRASKAVNTIRGYQTNWHAFCAWTESQAWCPLPAAPEVVAAFIAESAGRPKVGSVQRILNSIAEAHKAAGLESPTPPPSSLTP
jgi:hypothetical protein